MKVTLLFFSVFVYSAVCGQSYRLADYVTVSSSTTDKTNPLFVTFLHRGSPFDPSTVNNSIDLVNLKNGEKVMVCSLISSGPFNKVYIIYDPSTTKYQYCFANETPSKIDIADSNKSSLYSISDSNGKVVLTNTVNISSDAKSCFQSCVDYAHDQITADFLGYIAWESNIGVRIAVGYSCHRICNGLSIHQTW